MSEPLRHQIEPLVDEIATGLEEMLDRSFAFFGHSMGALVAFRVTQELRQRQRPLPLGLIVSGCRPPHLRDDLLPKPGASDAELIETIRKLNGTPRELLENRDLLEILLPVLRADFELLSSDVQVAEPPLDLPLVAYGGLEDTTVQGGHLAAWEEYTSSTFKLRLFPGDHFFLHASQRMLVDVISRELAQWGKT